MAPVVAVAGSLGPRALLSRRRRARRASLAIAAGGRRRSSPRARCSPETRVSEAGVSGTDNAKVETDDGAGGKGGIPPSSGGGGADGGDDQGKYWSEVSPFIAGLSQGLDRFPAEFRKEITSGLVPLVFVKRYLDLQAKLATALLMKIPGFRNKLLADPNLSFKLGIELGIGVFTKCSAEYQKRKPNFMKEVDFALANLLMALVADWMLVYLPAPTMVFSAARARSGGRLASALPFQGFLRTLPKNAFQKVPSMMTPFTVTQRIGALAYNGTKLLGVGCFASFIGVAMTNVLTEVRHRMNPEKEKLNKAQNVLSTSLLYGAYMGINSNVRYQMVAGLEERVLAPFLSQGQFTLASTILRVSNTYLGSLMWVDTLRLVGMQPQKKE